LATPYIPGSQYAKLRGLDAQLGATKHIGLALGCDKYDVYSHVQVGFTVASRSNHNETEICYALYELTHSQQQEIVENMNTNSNEQLRLKAEHIAKTYATGIWPLDRKNQVLTDASLQVRQGEIVALVGANGSGKSTLMMIIAGALSRDAGKVKINGTVGYCPQYPILYEKLTVDETFGLFGTAYNMPEQEIESRTSALLDELGFGYYRDYRIEHLSGGTKQKLNLALALLHDPELLLLDEPYSGFDYETYLRFWDMSESLAEQGHSILIISHFVQERERFDQIYRVEEGGCVREE